jgi:hypothetical protein
LGGVLGALGGLAAGTVAIITAPLSLTVVAGAAVGTAVAGLGGGLLGSLFGADVTYKKIVNEVWNEKTERFKYTALDGHTILAAPNFTELGQGRLRIFNLDEHSFEFEITAFQGEYSGVFDIKERWMHRAASGEYEYPKSLLVYMKDLKKTIGQKIEDDPSGGFNII